MLFFEKGKSTQKIWFYQLNLDQNLGKLIRNYPVASRIIRDALEEKVIKEDDPENKSRKYASYVSFWLKNLCDGYVTEWIFVIAMC